MRIFRHSRKARPQQPLIDARDLPRAIDRREKRRCIEALLQRRRKDGLDLRAGIVDHALQARIRAVTHEAQAEHQRLAFLRREHQRRQVEPAFEHVADARLPPHRHARNLQADDIPIDRALGNAGFLRKARSRDRPAMPSQGLRQFASTGRPWPFRFPRLFPTASCLPLTEHVRTCDSSTNANGAAGGVIRPWRWPRDCRGRRHRHGVLPDRTL